MDLIVLGEAIETTSQTFQSLERYRGSEREAGALRHRAIVSSLGTKIQEMLMGRVGSHRYFVGN